MTTIRFERDGAIGNIVLANPPFNRLDLRFAEALRTPCTRPAKATFVCLSSAPKGRISASGRSPEWPGKDVNWFRTFVADVNVSYRAIETLKIPTVAVVQGDRVRWRLRAGAGLRFPCCGRQCRFPLCGSHHGHAADRRRPAANCRARRPCPGITICHAGRADFRTRGR